MTLILHLAAPLQVAQVLASANYVVDNNSINLHYWHRGHTV